MKFKTFKDLSLSWLGMGNMRLPVQADKDGTPIDRPRAEEIIDYAMANGVNYFDTAYVYHNGESEKFLGEALAKYPRSQYYLATKYFVLANPDSKAVFEEQLSRLKTDYIDFYLIHGIFDHTYQQYLDNGSIEYFQEQQKKGRIKYLGFSTHANIENLTTFVNHHAWDFGQIQLNYFDWMYGTAKKEYDILTQKGIPIIVMEPVRGGRLTSLSPIAEALLKEAHPEWSIASWAFRWLKRQPQVKVVLSGMSDMAQTRENVALFEDDRALTDEEETLLMKACEAFRDQVRVPCTACRYCCDNCPANINIPAVLEIYNRYKTDGPWALQGLNSVDTKGKPADCTGCDACSSHCPQNIDIKTLMHELANLSAR